LSNLSILKNLLIMTSTTEKQPTRFLGEGSVGKCFKRYMFVDDTRFGRVYIPLDAAWPKAPDCTDLRNVFSTNDNVVFTAIRQAQKQHECSYIACSVIHKSDLQNVSGKMTEKCNQYAYCESSKLGKIFVPFSARGEGNRPWYLFYNYCKIYHVLFLGMEKMLKLVLILQ
jgi:hypothetical protein